MKLRVWSSIVCVALTSSLVLLRPSTASAATFSWTGNAAPDFFWTNALNWGGNVIPAAGGNILFADTVSQVVELGANQTIGSLTFFAEDTYTLNNFVLTLGGNVSQQLNGTVIINSGLATGSSARTLNNVGSGEFTINGVLSGTNAVTFAGGNFTLANAANTASGGINVNGGRVTLSSPAGLNLNSAAGASQAGAGAINIGGGQLRLLPGGAGTVGDIGRVVNFGGAGGSLVYAGNPGNNVALSLNSTAASGTPGTVVNGTPNIAADGTGWSASAPSINLTGITGSGATRFQLTNGALLRISNTNIGSAITIQGHSGGNAFVGATNNTVGRVLISGGAVNTFGGGLTFQNFNQVTIDSGVAADANFPGGRAIDGNITINSGATAFSGWASANNSANNLILGLPGNTTRTLTIQSGATAILDLQNRADGAVTVGITPATTFVGGVMLNMPTIINAGGNLTLTRTLTTNNSGVTPTVSKISVNRTITAQGTTASESVLNLLTGATSGGVNGVEFATASSLVVNGTGLGGLRVQGTEAFVGNYLTTNRIKGLTGSGGTLTFAYSDSPTKLINIAPDVASSVSLGLDKQGSGAPVYNLGAAANDLNNWRGIVVKGGTVNLGVNEAFAGALDVTGGSFNVGGNVSFGTNANITGGTLSVASGRTLTARQVFAGASATVTGSGTITSSSNLQAMVGGTLTPGASAGTLRFVGGLVLSNATVLNFELATPGVVGVGVNDLIQSQGPLTLDGVLNVTALTGFGEGTYTLFTYSGALVNNTLNFGTMPAGYQGSIVTTPTLVNLVVVPEPSTYALMALGLSALWLVRRGRRS